MTAPGTPAEDGAPSPQTTTASEGVTLDMLLARMDEALERLRQTSAVAKIARRGQILDLARRIMARPGGVAGLYERASAMEEAGVFSGTDWDHPEILQPSFASNTLRLADKATALLECLSQVRLMAVANGAFWHPSISAEQARHYMAQVLALNLPLVFDTGSEVLRTHPLGSVLRNLYGFIVERIGYENVLDQLIDEIWRILSQRPIILDGVKGMITQIAVYLSDPNIAVEGGGRGADRLISALYGPTTASREDPGIGVYAERLEAMDDHALLQEARAFARAMHDTGLVSPYHPVFLRYVLANGGDMVSQALGLSSTGHDAYLCYRELVNTLIEEAVHPETAQAVLGIAMLLERGILYMPALGPALWRQLSLPLSPTAEQAIGAACGIAQPAHVHLLAGILSVLGQPLGVGQGDNPTCQAARAISMWSYIDPGYLLQLVTWAARDDEVIMSFEGDNLSSRNLIVGMTQGPLLDVDAVSAVLVPHLDRLYMEMGRLCEGRGEDPHRWINPAFHGWWVGHHYKIAIDVATGKLQDYETFLRCFYATYHPLYNGGKPIIYPQPAGLAVTDSAGRFIGWHAIAIYRVTVDQQGEMRIYFYNPNNDGGQDWGQGIVVSTEGNGERFGESSLPVGQFASRLYLFHYDPLEFGDADGVPKEDVARDIQLALESWAGDRAEGAPIGT